MVVELRERRRVAIRVAHALQCKEVRRGRGRGVGEMRELGLDGGRSARVRPSETRGDGGRLRHLVLHVVDVRLELVELLEGVELERSLLDEALLEAEYLALYALLVLGLGAIHLVVEHVQTAQLDVLELELLEQLLHVALLGPAQAHLVARALLKLVLAILFLFKLCVAVS